MAQSHFNPLKRPSTTSTPLTNPAQLTCRQLIQTYLDRIDAFERKVPTSTRMITVNADALRKPTGSTRPTDRPAPSVRCTAFR